MSLGFPIEADDRVRTFTVSSGQTVFGPFSFKIFDIADVVLETRATVDDPWTEVSSGVTVALTGAAPATFTVTKTGLATGLLGRVKGVRVPVRKDNATRAGSISSPKLEDDLDKLNIIAQETRRDSSEALDVAREAAADAAEALETTEEALAAIQLGPVQSVNGRGGVVSLAKSDVGLSNADNTADANKPVSGPQAAALAAIGEVHTNPVRYGAAGNNAGDQNAAFATIPNGRIVNGLGLKYRLPAGIPNHIQLYNCTVNNGSRYIGMPRNPRQHPLDGDFQVIETSEYHHHFPGFIGRTALASDDMLIRVQSKGYRHEHSPCGPLEIVQSANGATDVFRANVYASDASNGYQPRGLVGAYLGGTRFGVLALVQAPDLSSIELRWIESTDYFRTRSVNIQITADVNLIGYPHGEATFTQDGTKVRFFALRDKRYLHMYEMVVATGAWTISLVKDCGASDFAEPIVVSLDDARHLIYLRRRDGTGDDLAVFTSTGLTAATSGAVVASGVPNGSNPPYITYDWGYVWFYLAARQSAIDSYKHALIYNSVDAEALWSAGGVWSVSMAGEWRVARRLRDNALVYLNTFKNIDGTRQGILIEGETRGLGSANPGGSTISLIGGEQPSAPAILSRIRRRPPITRNPNFAIWRRNQGGVSGTSAFFGPDGWRISSSGVSVTANRIDNSSTNELHIKRMLTSAPAFSLGLDSAAGGSGRTMRQRYYGQEARALLGQRVYFNMVLNGSFPYATDCARVEVTINPGTGGSGAPGTLTFTFPQQQSPQGGGLMTFGMPGYIPTGEGITWASGANEATAYVEIVYLFNAAGALSANIREVWTDLGDAYLPLDPVDMAVELEKCRRHFRRLNFGNSDLIANGVAASSTLGDFLLLYDEMIAQPSLALIGSTVVGDLMVSGSVAGTAFAFGAHSESAGRLRLTVAGGLTTGAAYQLYASSNGAQLGLDCEV